MEQFTAARLAVHRFVAVTGSGVADWVAASAVSARPVYRGVVEHSVYVHAVARGQGTGGALLAALIASTETAAIWTIQSSIFPENTASAALHSAAGFRVVGTGNGSPGTTAAGATPCSWSAAAASCNPCGHAPGGQEFAARRGASRSTRRLS